MQTEVLYAGYSYHDKPLVPHLTCNQDYYLIRLQTEGTCQIKLDGQSERLVPGDLLFLRPGESYQLVVEENEDGKTGSGDYYVFCRGPWIDLWSSMKHRPKRAFVQTDNALLSLWKLIVLERRRLDEDNGELVNSLLQSLILMLEKAIERSGETVKGGAAYLMKRFIEEHATRTFTVEEVAVVVRFSPSRASKLFKAAFGESIVKYAMRVRLSIALERMHYSGLTLEQIAESCGFGSYPYFYRIFMRTYGVPPRQYRIEAGEGHLLGD